MASPTAPILTATGISAPPYSDILTYLQQQYQSIYGSDIYLGNDSQDGQFLAIIASAINDANAAAIAVYNSFSPATAQGNALSSNVKLNGIKRLVPTNSTADLTIVGVAGTAITNGVVQDANNNKWALPATVNIPSSGQVTVTATCTTAGAIAAAANTINQIVTPQLGWQSATNPAAAVLGSPVESDAALRQRQATSVAQPAQTPLEAVAGAVAAVSGVTRFAAYENPTGATDGNGLPAHSIALVVEGGAASDIASAIALKKTIGTTTYGTTAQTVTNAYGYPEAISYFPVAEQRIVVNLDVHPVNGYSSAIGTEIQNSIANYINALPIGSNVMRTRLYLPAVLNGSVDGLTYEVTGLDIAAYLSTPAASDVTIAFNQAAHCDPSDVTINLV